MNVSQDVVKRKKKTANGRRVAPRPLKTNNAMDWPAKRGRKQDCAHVYHNQSDAL